MCQGCLIVFASTTIFTPFWPQGSASGSRIRSFSWRGGPSWRSSCSCLKAIGWNSSMPVAWHCHTVHFLTVLQGCDVSGNGCDCVSDHDSVHLLSCPYYWGSWWWPTYWAVCVRIGANEAWLSIQFGLPALDIPCIRPIKHKTSLRRKALQKISNQMRALMKGFESSSIYFWLVLDGSFLHYLCRSVWLTPHVVRGVLCPAEEERVSEMRRSCALQQLLGF